MRICINSMGRIKDMTADVGDRGVISAVLLPNDQDAAELVACSQAINTLVKSAVRLGGASIPHITLAQFFASADEAPNLWRDIEQLQGRVNEATSTGLCFLPEQTRDNTWVELSFFQTTALTELRNAVFASSFAGRFEINNGDLDRFRPHVTLAMYPGKQTLAINLAEFGVFRHTYKNLRLAVGINGPNLSLVKVVA